MTSIGIIGSKGRMGQALYDMIGKQDDLHFAGGIDQGDDPVPLAKACNILIDFSSPRALVANLSAAVAAETPILIGTTGLEDEHFQSIKDASYHIPVLQTGNTSLGVTLLAKLVREAAHALGDDWDIEIVETHHRLKVDSPSGTAKLLGKAAAEGRGIKLETHTVGGRDGITGAREQGVIGFASLRGGTVAGDHSVNFLADNERIQLIHIAENRDIFARGALKAARWLVRQGPGQYAMEQVLSL